MDIKKMLGCLKSPHDKKDILMESILAPIALPPESDYTQDFTPVRSQGNEGTCVGFAMSVGCMEYWEKEESGVITELSPRFLYYNAQKIDGISGKHEGTHLLAACKVAQTLGTCKESLLPYIPQDTVEPEIIHYKDALQYRIKVYTRVRTLDQLKQAIFDPQVKAVLVGVKVYKGMISEEAKKTGITPNPSCWDKFNVLGGHALCAGAFVDKSPYYKDGHIRLKGSWGEGYGDVGYHYLSYDYINANMLDAFACIDIHPSELKNYAFERIGDRKEWLA